MSATWPHDSDASMVLTARTAHLRGFRPVPPAAAATTAAATDRSARAADVTPVELARERMARLWLLTVMRSK